MARCQDPGGASAPPLKQPLVASARFLIPPSPSVFLQVAKKEKAAEELAAEYQRRMALLKTKEYLEKARNRIFGNGKRSVRDMILTNSPYSPTHRGATDGEVRLTYKSKPSD